MAPPGLEQPELGAIITGGQSKNLKWVGNRDLEKKRWLQHRVQGFSFIFRI